MNAPINNAPINWDLQFKDCTKSDWDEARCAINQTVAAYFGTTDREFILRHWPGQKSLNPNFKTLTMLLEYPDTILTSQRYAFFVASLPTILSRSICKIPLEKLYGAKLAGIMANGWTELNAVQANGLPETRTEPTQDILRKNGNKIKINRANLVAPPEWGELKAPPQRLQKAIWIIDAVLVCTNKNIPENKAIRRKDILSDNRAAHIVYPRQAAMLIACEVLPPPRNSYPELGNRFNRDHSSVIAAHNKMAAIYNREEGTEAEQSELRDIFAQVSLWYPIVYSHIEPTTTPQSVERQVTWTIAPAPATPAATIPKALIVDRSSVLVAEFIKTKSNPVLAEIAKQNPNLTFGELSKKPAFVELAIRPAHLWSYVTDGLTQLALSPVTKSSLARQISAALSYTLN